MEYKIAIVNSNTYGERYPDIMEKLGEIGEYERLSLPKNMRGKELAKALEGFNIVIASVTPIYDKEFFQYKKDLKLLARHGIGYNNIDCEAASEVNTIVTNVSAVIEKYSVAENAVANLLAVMRRTVDAATAAKEGRWQERQKFIGHELQGKTAGIIGYGNIGSRAGEIFRKGYNMTLLVYDPYKDPEEVEKTGAKLVSLDELLRQSDIISLHALVTDETYHLISDKEFNQMKTGVYITNVSRGELLDEEAVIRALDNGKIGGLALDVVENEPIDQTHPFFKYDNVVITPHTSAYTDEGLRGMGEKVLHDIQKVANGEEPDSIVNKMKV